MEYTAGRGARTEQLERGSAKALCERKKGDELACHAKSVLSMNGLFAVAAGTFS